MARRLLLLLATAAGIGSCAASGLVDHPIAGTSVTYIDTVTGGAKWTAASSAGDTITASVPGDLITDLEVAGKVGDPLHELNWLNPDYVDQWWTQTWTYSTSFALDTEATAAAAQAGGEVLLVFDGIKMGAKISVNGVLLGTADDQFLRYVFPLKASGVVLDMSADGANTVSVVFEPSIDVNGRFMACTGGWDWAPYTNTQQEGANTMTKGIWKSVYTVAVPAGTAAITHLVPHTFYNGSFPTAPLQEHNHGGFRVSVRAHLWAAAAINGASISTQGSWSGTGEGQSLDVPAGNSSVTIEMFADAKDIELWWPTGIGAQPLYNVSASLKTGAGAVSATRRIGFRFFALVTGNDTDPAYVEANKDVDGTDTMGMRFRVNGAPIWSRGANMIPMDEMEGRYSAVAHRQMVASAVKAGMNTLRVWGGGVFLPDAWYDACDEMGIIVYHDMQFAQQGHSPCDPACSTQDAEFRHQVRRLSHHPAIVIWDGCNECRVKLGTPTGIYATFVLTVVAQEDKSRVVWPSCPAHGWDHGVNRLSALPNDSPKGLAPSTSNTAIETHGPYQHGGGFPAVNGANDLEDFDPQLPIKIWYSDPVGLAYPNVFASEFGGSVWSSFESTSPTLEPEHWSLHGGSPPDTCTGGFGKVCKGNNTAAQRNYACDNYLSTYYGIDPKENDAVGEAAFKKQLYLCMMGQALLVSTTIQQRRSQNHFGCIVWQYGEIWPTGGWGSVEWGRPTTGQVVGGRWKPLQYMYKATVYTDVTAACGMSDKGAWNCYVKNDAAAKPFVGSVVVTAVDLATGASEPVHTFAATMAAGPGVMEWFDIDLSKFNVNESVLVVDVLPAGETAAPVSHNVQLLAKPSDLKLAKANVAFIVADAASPDGSVDITVTTTGGAALFVTFTTTEQGIFSDNALLSTPGAPLVIKFEPVAGIPVDIAKLKSTLRVEHFATYLVA